MEYCIRKSYKESNYKNKLEGFVEVQLQYFHFIQPVRGSIISEMAVKCVNIMIYLGQLVLQL